MDPKTHMYKKPVEGKPGEYETNIPYINNKLPFSRQPTNTPTRNDELINKKLDNILKILNKLNVKDDTDIINEEVKPKPAPKMGRPKKT